MKSSPSTLFIDSMESYEMVRPMLERTLDQPRITHCMTHKDALEYIESDQYADIIFADWHLTGRKFMDSVRRDPENHNTPVIIMSENMAIQHSVLDRDSTFFLAKPFLEKGLTITFNQVMKRIERRRKNRIHPSSELYLDIRMSTLKQYTFPLVDISIDGCFLRVPIKNSHEMKIFESTVVYLSIDEYSIEVQGEIFRISPDFSYPEIKETVLVMIMFNTSAQETRELQELIDDLGKRW